MLFEFVAGQPWSIEHCSKQGWETKAWTSFLGQSKERK